jgi:hypothetical protein
MPLHPLVALRAACFATQTFRTVVDVAQAPFAIGPDSRCLFLGSCFAENIGGRVHGVSLVNPSHGIVFNPLSLALVLERIASARAYGAADVGVCALDGARRISYEHHSRFGFTPRADVRLETEVDARLNAPLAAAHAHLAACDTLVLTLGTSWAFTRDGRAVANCHKQPAANFARRLVGVEEATDVLATAIGAARALAPGLRVLLTVSPVRHWKDGPVDNARSKAALLLVAHALVERLGGATCSYFPAYELMMDELRDYRFYERDMLHPSEVAVEFIYERFADAYLAPPVRERNGAIEAVRRAARHRPLQGAIDGAELPSSSDALRRFARGQLEKIDALAQRWGEPAERALAEERAHFGRLVADGRAEV